MRNFQDYTASEIADIFLKALSRGFDHLEPNAIDLGPIMATAEVNAKAQGFDPRLFLIRARDAAYEHKAQLKDLTSLTAHIGIIWDQHNGLIRAEARFQGPGIEATSSFDNAKARIELYHKTLRKVEQAMVAMNEVLLGCFAYIGHRDNVSEVRALFENAKVELLKHLNATWDLCTREPN